MFGGLVTSPLYVYSMMPLKSPTEDDYLGIYNIMFWTVTLIGLFKYATIALRADDRSWWRHIRTTYIMHIARLPESLTSYLWDLIACGTFSLYSLLCRNMNVIETLSSRPSNPNSSSLSCSIYDEGTQNQAILAIFFRKSIVARRLLLFIDMLGMCMVIGDGILTPTISGNFPTHSFC